MAATDITKVEIHTDWDSSSKLRAWGLVRDPGRELGRIISENGFDNLPRAEGQALLREVATDVVPISNSFRAIIPEDVEERLQMLDVEIDGDAAGYTTAELTREEAEAVAAYLLDDRWVDVAREIRERIGVDILADTPGSPMRVLNQLEGVHPGLLLDRRGRGFEVPLAAVRADTPRREDVLFDRDAGHLRGEPLITELLERGVCGTGNLHESHKDFPRVQQLEAELWDAYPDAVVLRSDNGMSLNVDAHEVTQLWNYLNDDRWIELEAIGASPFVEDEETYNGPSEARLVNATSRLVLMKNIHKAFPELVDTLQPNEALYPEAGSVLTADGPVVDVPQHFHGQGLVGGDVKSLAHTRVDHVTHQFDGALDGFRSDITDVMRTAFEERKRPDFSIVEKLGAEARDLRLESARELADLAKADIVGMTSGVRGLVGQASLDLRTKAEQTPENWMKSCVDTNQRNMERAKAARQQAKASTAVEMRSESSVKSKSSESPSLERA